MKFRFIEYQGDLYVVLGITYDKMQECPDCFVAAPVDKKNSTLFKAALELYTINIPFSQAIEITNKNRLKAIMVLYGP